MHKGQGQVNIVDVYNTMLYISYTKTYVHVAQI